MNIINTQSKLMDALELCPNFCIIKHSMMNVHHHFVLVGHDEDEISEGYLDIVPDTTPEDVEKGKKSTFSRSVQ